MDIYKLIEQFRNKLREGRFINEASISQGIVLPSLQALKWDVFNTDTVCPEYPIGSRRVDFALLNPAQQPILLIEVKKPGKAEGADRQLFEYSFHQGVPFVLLTDGREWHFYLPGEQGNYNERRVYKIDLFERDTNEVASRLSRYLEYSRLCNGSALLAAREDYQHISSKRQIEETLPKAWNRILEEPNELAELLATKVEDLCGYKPEFEICADFLSSINNPQPAHQPSTNDSIKQQESQPASIAQNTHKIDPSFSTLNRLRQMDLSGRKPSHIMLEGDIIETRDWADLCIQLVEWLNKKGYLSRQKIPVYNSAGKDKYFISFQPEHIDPRKDGNWKQVGIYYIDIKYNSSAHIRNIISALEQLDLKTLDIKINI